MLRQPLFYLTLFIFILFPSVAAAANFSIVLTAIDDSGAPVENADFRYYEFDETDEINIRYISALDREATSAEIANIISANYANYSDITAVLVTSSEHITNFGGISNSNYVTAKYVSALGYSPTSAELAFWTNELNSGLSKNEYIEELLDINNGKESRAFYASERNFNTQISLKTTLSDGNTTPIILDDTKHYSVEKVTSPQGYEWQDPQISQYLDSNSTFILDKYAELNITIRNPLSGTNWSNTNIDVNGVTYTTNSSGIVSLDAVNETGTFTITPLPIAGAHTYTASYDISYQLNDILFETVNFFDLGIFSNSVNETLFEISDESVDVSVSTTVTNYSVGSAANVTYQLYGPFATNAFGTKEGNETLAEIVVIDSSLTGSSSDINSGNVTLSEPGFYVWEVTSQIQDVGYGFQPPVLESFESFSLTFEIREIVEVKTFVADSSLNIPTNSSGVNSFNAELINLDATETASVFFEIYGPFPSLDDLDDDPAFLFNSVTQTVTGSSAQIDLVSSGNITFSQPGFYVATTEATVNGNVVVDETWNQPSSNAWFFIGEEVVFRGYVFARNINNNEEFLPVEGTTVEIKSQSGTLYGNFISDSNGFVTATVPSGSVYCATVISPPDSLNMLMDSTNPFVRWNMDSVISPNIIEDTAGNFDGVSTGTSISNGNSVIFDGETNYISNTVGVNIGGTNSFSVGINVNFSEDSVNNTETVYALYNEFANGEIISLNSEFAGSSSRRLVLDMFDESFEIGTVATNTDHVIVMSHDSATNTMNIYLNSTSPQVVATAGLTDSPSVYVGSLLGSQNLTGTVKDFFIYDKERTQLEVEDIFEYQNLPVYSLDLNPRCTSSTIDFNMTADNAVQLPLFNDEELISTGFASLYNIARFMLLFSGLFFVFYWLSFRKQLKDGILL